METIITHHYLQPRPVYVRIPRSGELCPHSGLTRSTMLALVLPCHANGFRPPVESRKPVIPGKTRGIRLVVWTSLEAYIRSCPTSRQAQSAPIRLSA